MRKFKLDDFAQCLCQLVCAGGGLSVAGVAFQDVGDFLHVAAFAKLADGLQVAIAAAHELEVVHLAVFVVEGDELGAGATGSEFLSLHKSLALLRLFRFRVQYTILAANSAALAIDVAIVFAIEKDVVGIGRILETVVCVAR